MAWTEEAMAEQKQVSEKNIVFLIGDSIREGYCETVRRELAEDAEVVYPDENCRFSQYILVRLRQWAGMCDPRKVVLVHFNCGHWDAAQWSGEEGPLNTPEQYQENIRRIIACLRRIFPNAKLVFATTTPMNPNGSNSANPRTTERIIAFNRAGVEAAKACCVKVNDLFSFTKEWDPSCYLDYCHYTAEHARILGEHVAEFIRAEL